MTGNSTAGRNPFADIAPALAEYTDRVLFGDVWQRPGLSSRDRSLITVAADRKHGRIDRQARLPGTRDLMRSVVWNEYATTPEQG